MPGDAQTALQDIGGAVTALFGASGASASADSYAGAAQIARQNALISKEATQIEQTQASRQIFQTIGKQAAGVAGAGFKASGTALDLLRSSASQGALTKAILATKGAITENSYAEQAGLYSGLSSAASSSATGQQIGGVIQAAGGIISGVKALGSIIDLGGSSSSASDAGAFWTGDTTAEDLAFGSGSGDVASFGSFVGPAINFASNGINSTTIGQTAGALIGNTILPGVGGVVGSVVGGAASDIVSGVGDAISSITSGCFITTAIMHTLGKPDDCEELNTLRKYRDGWLKENHPDDILEYYMIAPQIVANINKLDNPDKFWRALYSSFLSPALEAVRKGDDELAYRIYRRMVEVAKELGRHGENS